MPELLNAPALARGRRRSASQIFRGVFEHGPTPTALTDLEGQCLDVNRAMCELTGYSQLEMVTKRLGDLTHPDDAESDGALRSRLLAGEIESYRIEQRYVTADGRTEWCQKAVGALRDVDGTPLRLVVHVENISERKRAEQQLRRLADYDSLTGLRNRRVFEDDLCV